MPNLGTAEEQRQLSTITQVSKDKYNIEKKYRRMPQGTRQIAYPIMYGHAQVNFLKDTTEGKIIDKFSGT